MYDWIIIFIILMAMLVLPTFFIWRWLLKKYIKADRKRKIATWVATIILTPLIYLCIFMLVAFCASYYSNKQFNLAKWESKPDKRYVLSKNLIESKNLMGKSKSEVEQYLGGKADFVDSGYWYYSLGYLPELLGYFDDESPSVLQIKFKNNKVNSIEQINNW